eukprot:Gregarina_sp_Poly_1__8333@NODE_487_length_7975_cov_341_032752_g393_i0_p1_GENE_NODE_487_length_7975_cov_341_032752_g393_i0NODE_487_length_7975_cov_341_032752_g393_i0_p1_ORF_typecomplete_len1144_score142_72_NODE_487_length_7975_cov_341_032752_g393_i023765807
MKRISSRSPIIEGFAQPCIDVLPITSKTVAPSSSPEKSPPRFRSKLTSPVRFSLDSVVDHPFVIPSTPSSEKSSVTSRQVSLLSQVPEEAVVSSRIALTASTSPVEIPITIRNPSTTLPSSSSPRYDAHPGAPRALHPILVSPPAQLSNLQSYISTGSTNFQPRPLVPRGLTKLRPTTSLENRGLQPESATSIIPNSHRQRPSCHSDSRSHVGIIASSSLCNSVLLSSSSLSSPISTSSAECVKRLREAARVRSRTETFDGTHLNSRHDLPSAVGGQRSMYSRGSSILRIGMMRRPSSMSSIAAKPDKSGLMRGNLKTERYNESRAVLQSTEQSDDHQVHPPKSEASVLPYHRRRFKFPPSHYRARGTTLSAYPTNERKNSDAIQPRFQSDIGSPLTSLLSGLYGLGGKCTSTVSPIPIALPSVEMPRPLTDQEKLNLRMHRKNAMGIRLGRRQEIAARIFAKDDEEAIGVLRSCRLRRQGDFIDSPRRLLHVFRQKENFISDYGADRYLALKIAPEMRTWAKLAREKLEIPECPKESAGAKECKVDRNTKDGGSTLGRSPSNASTRASSSRSSSGKPVRLIDHCWCTPSEAEKGEFAQKEKTPESEPLPAVVLTAAEFHAFEEGCRVRPPHPVTLETLRVSELLLFGDGTSVVYLLARSWSRYEASLNLEHFAKRRDGSLWVGKQKSLLSRLFHEQGHLRDLHDKSLQDLTGAVPHLNLHQLTFLRRQLPAGAAMSGREEMRNFTSRLDNSITESVCSLVCDREGLKLGGMSVFQRLQSTLINDVPISLPTGTSVVKNEYLKQRQTIESDSGNSEPTPQLKPQLKKAFTKWEKQSIGRRIVTMFGVLFHLKKSLDKFIGPCQSLEHLEVTAAHQTWWFVPVKDLIKSVVASSPQSRGVLGGGRNSMLRNAFPVPNKTEDSSRSVAAKPDHFFIQFPGLIASVRRPLGELIYSLRTSVLGHRDTAGLQAWDLRELPILGDVRALEPPPGVTEALQELKSAAAFLKLRNQEYLGTKITPPVGVAEEKTNPQVCAAESTPTQTPLLREQQSSDGKDNETGDGKEAEVFDLRHTNTPPSPYHHHHSVRPSDQWSGSCKSSPLQEQQSLGSITRERLQLRGLYQPLVGKSLIREASISQTDGRGQGR